MNACFYGKRFFNIHYFGLFDPCFRGGISGNAKKDFLLQSLGNQFIFTPLAETIVLLRTSKKVTVTHYNVQDQCADCPHWEQHEPEGCEFIGNLRKRLSVNRRYSI